MSWSDWADGDQCDPNPCLHGGNCTDMVGGFHCSCPPPHYGLVCELGDNTKGNSGGGRPPTLPQSKAPG